MRMNVWKCSVDLRNYFMCNFQELLVDNFLIVLRVWIVLKKTSFMLRSELWEDDFSSMLDLVKDYIVDVWELRKARLYGKNPSILQS